VVLCVQIVTVCYAIVIKRVVVVIIIIVYFLLLLLFLWPARKKPVGARKLKKETTAVGVYSVAVNVLRKETTFPR